MKDTYAKMTFRIIFISFLALILIGCGESGTPGGASGPGVTASIALNSDAVSLPADGITSVTISATLVDSVSQPVLERTSIVFRTNHGTFRNGSTEYKVKTVDASGTVSVQLTSATTPGTAEVWVESNDVTQKIEVKFYDPHKVGTITLRTGSASITADGISQVSIIATVNDALGNPEEGATVSFKTTLGQFIVANPLNGIINRSTTALTDVDGEAAVMLVSGTTIGTATILASLDGLNATTPILFTAGEPTTISLRAAPSTIRPNGTSNLFAKLLDINGNPVEEKIIVFSQLINMSEGTLNPLSATTNVNGEAQATYTAGKDPGADIIQAALSTDRDMKMTTTIVVDPAAIVVDAINVTAGSASLVADGQSKVKIRAVVTDNEGNPAIGKTVTFTATAGTLSSTTAATNEFGLAEVMLQSTTIAGPITVRAECDGFIGEVPVEFVPGPADHIIMYAFPDVVPPNGAFQTAAIVQDQYDNRIDDQRLMLQVRRAGHTEIVDTAEMTPDQAEDGVFRFDWNAAIAYGPGNLEITARVNNGVSKTVTVVVDETATIVGSINVTAGAEEIKADGTSSVLIRAIVLDYTGQPAQGITVDFSTTLGTLSSVEKETDANGIADVMLTAGTDWGTATVSADANGFWDTADVRFTSLKAGGVSLTAIPNIVEPGGQSTVIAELRDAKGSPVPDEVLYFDIYENNTGGFLSAIEGITDTNGRVTITYTAGTNLTDLCGICLCSGDRIRVTLASDSSITDTTCITVAIPTGTVGYITLTSDDSSLPADGISSTAVTATVYDTAGLPMSEGTPITFTTTLGTFPGGIDPDGLGPITSQVTFSTLDDSGKVITSLIAGTSGGVAQITAVSGGVSQLLYIILDDGSVAVGSIVLTSNPTSIPADGASSSAITAVIKDTAGNPVPIGTPVVFTTTMGTFANTLFPTIVLYTTNTSGTVTTSLIAGLTDGVAWVTAAAGNMTQAIEISILEELIEGVTVISGAPSLVADGVSETVIRATVTDANGNPAENVNVTFATTLGTLIGTNPGTTNASGVAEVMLQSATTTGTAIVTATANGFTASVNVAFVSGAPGTAVVSATPTVLNPGDTSTVTAILTDINSHPMVGETVNFNLLVNNSGAVLSTVSAVTDVNGRAAIIYTAGPNNGDDTVTARSSSQADISGSVEIVVGGQVSLVAAPTSIIANGISTSTFTATVLNNAGTPVPGVQVVFKDLSLGSDFDSLPALAIQNTDAAGQATYVYTSTTTTKSVTIGIKAGNVQADATIQQIAGPIANVDVFAAPSILNPGSEATITAKITDVNNNPVVGETVNFSITTNNSGATLGALFAVTDLSGEAIVTYTAGVTDSVTDTITATTTTGILISGTTTVDIDSAAVMVGSITIVSGAATLPADGMSEVTIRATVRDTGGNPVPSIGVNFTTTAGTILTAVPVVSDANGIAEVTLQSSVTAATATVTAYASGFRTSVDIIFTPGAPDDLDVNAAPSTVHPEGTSTVTATLTDVNGNPLAGETISFILTINNSGAILSNPSAVTNINGQATITYTAGLTETPQDRIRATSVSNTAVTGLVNIEVDASAIVVGGVTVISGAASIVADGTSTTLIRATVIDTDGNPASGITVNFATTLGILVGNPSPTTNAFGIAEVTLRSASNTGTAVVTAEASGFIASVNVAFVADVPDSILVTADPLIVNQGETSTVTATLLDMYDNPIPDETITFNFGTSNNSGASLSSSSAVTNINGQATVTYTAGNTGPVTDTITATSVTDTSIDNTVDIDVIGGNTASQISVRIVDTTLDADGVSQTTAIVTALTALNQVVSGAQVIFAIDGGSITSPHTTDENGQAIATITSDRWNRSLVTVTASSLGAPDATATMSFVGVTMNVVADPATLLTGDISIISATLLDAADNPIAGQSVAFSTDRGTVTLTAITDALGIATAVASSTTSGDANITASARNATGTTTITYGSYVLQWIGTTDTPIFIGGTTSVYFQLLNNGLGDNGQTVSFSSTLGTLSPTFAGPPDSYETHNHATYGDGVAEVLLTAGTQTGRAVIDAAVTVGGTTTLNAQTTVLIVADTATKIVLTPIPGIISTNNGVSTIRAIVYDADDNVVPNQNVYFRINNAPGGGEYLSSSVQTTDIAGIAEVQFYAGAIPSNSIGDIEIEASTGSTFPAPPMGLCALTIAGPVAAVSVSVNLQELVAPSITQGHLEVGVSAIATDINGNPVADGTQVFFGISSIGFDEDRDRDFTIDCWNAAKTQYDFGTACIPGNVTAPAWVSAVPGSLGTTWFSDDVNQDGVMFQTFGIMAPTEDANENGILDVGEDKNDNGVMDPVQGVTVNSPVTTIKGIATTTIDYPMSYAWNIKVRVTAEAGGVDNFYDYILLCTEEMADNGTCGLGY